MMRHFDPATRQFDYLAGVAVNHPVTLAVECDVWHIPTQEYATFTCTLGTLVSTLELIYTQWVRVSPYYVCDGVRFEYYDAHFMGQPDSPMSLYLPIRKRVITLTPHHNHRYNERIHMHTKRGLQ
ncbi:MAG: GyrI-like domain-containing protein, partial [Roseiflexaceae bacterium]